MPDHYYKLLPKALGDLEGLWLYSVDKWGIEQTEQYLSELEQAFIFLSENPKICPERQELTPPVRIFHQGRHLIVYRIKEDHISIIRILHDSMDIERHL